MGKSSAPPPPDYAAAATAQGEANIDAARIAGRLNNPNYITPFGTRTILFGNAGGFDQGGYDAAMAKYQQDLANFEPVTRVGLGQVYNTPPTPPNQADFYQQDGTSAAIGSYDQPTVIEQLSPEGQALFDQQMRLSQAYGNIAEGGLSRVEQAMGTPFDVSGLPQVQGIDASAFGNLFLDDLPAISEDVLNRQRVEDALLQRLNPQLERARQQREEALIMQGQGRGGRAWQTAQEDLARGETEAQLGAILAGGEEQQRLFNMALANRGRAFNEALTTQQQNQATQQNLFGLQEANRNRALQEALALRQLPLSEINALRTGSQPNIPQFQSYQGQSIQPAPIFDATQAQYQADLGAANFRNAQRGQTLGALAGLGAAAFTGGGSLGFGSLFGGGAGAAGGSYFGGIG